MIERWPSHPWIARVLWPLLAERTAAGVPQHVRVRLQLCDSDHRASADQRAPFARSPCLRNMSINWGLMLGVLNPPRGTHPAEGENR
jgi:hypothetical protein